VTGSTRVGMKVALVVVTVFLAVLLAAELLLRRRDRDRIERARAANTGAAERFDRNEAEGTPRLTLDLALGPVTNIPAPVVPPPDRRGPRRWTTWGEFPEDGFSGHGGPIPPKRAGVVRITFHGGSTTWDGYPNLIQPLLDERFGPGRVEVINLGVPSANIEVSVLLLERFIDVWKPDVAVFQEGPNDVMYASNRFSFLLRELGGRLPETRAPPAIRGLAGWWDTQPWREATPLETGLAASLTQPALDAYWRLSRRLWARGVPMVVSNFPAPHPASLSDADRAWLDGELALLLSPLGDVDRFTTTVQSYNRMLSDFARASGTPLIDSNAALAGGRELFVDYCHTTPEGKRRHARHVFEGLLPIVTPLLEGRSPVVPPPSPMIENKVISLGTTSSGGCERGPCPEGACLVPGGASVLGESSSAIERGIERFRERWGLNPPGDFDTLGPARVVNVSAFCIDRQAVAERERDRCVEAGVCPVVNRTSASVVADEATLPTIEEAQRLCGFRGGRVPTDAEWEHARRRGFGLEASADGRWEWTNDCHARDLHERVADGVTDPFVAWSAGCRGTLRGGGRVDGDESVFERRSSQEGFPDAAPDRRGVRCVFGTPVRPTAIDVRPSTAPLPERQTL